MPGTARGIINPGNLLHFRGSLKTTSSLWYNIYGSQDCDSFDMV